MVKKAQCVYCGKIIFYKPSYGVGQDEMFEDEDCKKKVSRLERCPQNRMNGGTLGLHKYDTLYY